MGQGLVSVARVSTRETTHIIKRGGENGYAYYDLRAEYRVAEIKYPHTIKSEEGKSMYSIYFVLFKHNLKLGGPKTFVLRPPNSILENRH